MTSKLSINPILNEIIAGIEAEPEKRAAILKQKRKTLIEYVKWNFEESHIGHDAEDLNFAEQCIDKMSAEEVEQLFQLMSIIKTRKCLHVYHVYNEDSEFFDTYGFCLFAHAKFPDDVRKYTVIMWSSPYFVSDDKHLPYID